MILLDATDLAAARPGRQLFEGVSLTVSSGDRLGLVGINGTGKSTLLRVLAGKADPVFSQIQGLRLNPPVAPVAQPAAAPRLAGLLDPDVKAGTIAVRDEADRSVVTVRGDGLFAPASATLTPERVPLMERIAAAMAQNGGAVLITGHTDNQAIRTLRFPSNWHLSEERARTVRDLFITKGVAADRIRAEGRAEGEPIASNDTPDGRKQNRRVEVTLFPGKGPALTAPAAAAAASR